MAQVNLLSSQEAFFSAISFLLHACLVMLLYLFFNCLVQRSQVEELAVAQLGKYTVINQFDLVFYQGFILIMDYVP